MASESSTQLKSDGTSSTELELHEVIVNVPTEEKSKSTETQVSPKITDFLIH